VNKHFCLIYTAIVIKVLRLKANC